MNDSRIDKRKQKSKFFSPDRAKPTGLGKYQEEGLSSGTMKAYARESIPLYAIVNRIRISRKDKLELGGSAVAHFFTRITKDSFFAFQKAVGIYTTSGTALIPDVQKGIESDLENRYEKLKKEGKIKGD